MNEEQLNKKLYTDDVEYEWARLVRNPFHRLELDTTMHFLKKYLPKKGLILDAGGGPGRYTIELAKLGYDIVLLDLTPANLEYAKKQIKKAKVENRVKNIVEGSIVNLSIFKNNSFDAVICLGGPISHIAKGIDRKKAVSELVRVVKKNALVFVSVFGKFGAMLNSLNRWPHEIKIDKHFEEFSINGEDYMWHGSRGYAHFFTLNEFEKLFNNKLRILDEVGLEGLATASEDSINKIFVRDKRIMRNWLKSHYKLCTHPSVVDTSLHMLLVGRKK